MPHDSPSESSETASPARLPLVRDDLAYVLPMGIFLAITWVAAQWPAAFPWLYALKAFATAVALAILWPQFTKIRWDYWWLGLIVGAIGIVQWVGMQLFLQNHFKFFQPSADAFNPLTYFHSAATRDAFVAVRFFGAVLVVPVMEELFWRDFLWRQIIAPNDFKMAAVGEWEWTPFLVVAVAFSTVHGNWWLTAIVWALMIGALLVWTKSLGACVIAHATTNLLLGIYVLKYHDWAFW